MRHDPPGSSWLASARCDVMAAAPTAAPTAPAAARENALDDNTRKSMSGQLNGERGLFDSAFSKNGKMTSEL